MPIMRYNFPCHHCGLDTPAGPKALFLPTEPARNLPARMTPLCRKCLKRIEVMQTEHAASAAIPSGDPLSELVFDYQGDKGNPRLLEFRIGNLPRGIRPLTART